MPGLQKGIFEAAQRQEKSIMNELTAYPANQVRVVFSDERSLPVPLDWLNFCRAIMMLPPRSPVPPQNRTER